MQEQTKAQNSFLEINFPLTDSFFELSLNFKLNNNNKKLLIFLYKLLKFNRESNIRISNNQTLMLNSPR